MQLENRKKNNRFFFENKAFIELHSPKEIFWQLTYTASSYCCYCFQTNKPSNKNLDSDRENYHKPEREQTIEFFLNVNKHSFFAKKL